MLHHETAHLDLFLKTDNTLAFLVPYKFSSVEPGKLFLIVMKYTESFFNCITWVRPAMRIDDWQQQNVVQCPGRVSPRLFVTVFEVRKDY